MSKKTFLAALTLAADYGETATLGGGEPTLHPRFWEFIGLALAKLDADTDSIFVVTNGKIAATALALAGLARRGVFGVALSQDEWHDPIDPRVVQAFTRRHFHERPTTREACDLREIRKVDLIINEGRAAENEIGEDDDRCFCDDFMVEPDGKIWACGCRQVSFGTVWKPKIPQEYWDHDTRCFGWEDSIRLVERAAVEASAE
jgi:MoaA/NifB/PqqE/SkfB family radical SAM enzyme